VDRICSKYFVPAGENASGKNMTEFDDGYQQLSGREQVKRRM